MSGDYIKPGIICIIMPYCITEQHSPTTHKINPSAAEHAEPGAEAACLFYGTPGVSHAKRCADKGVASEGWDPKNRQPRSDRLLTCHPVTQYIMQRFVIVFSSGKAETTENVKDCAVWGVARDVL